MSFPQTQTHLYAAKLLPRNKAYPQHLMLKGPKAASETKLITALPDCYGGIFKRTQFFLGDFCESGWRHVIGRRLHQITRQVLALGFDSSLRPLLSHTANVRRKARFVFEEVFHKATHWSVNQMFLKFAWLLGVQKKEILVAATESALGSCRFSESCSSPQERKTVREKETGGPGPCDP